MLIEKEYNSIVTNAKLVDGHSTNNKAGYTCDYLNDHIIVVSPTEPSTDRKKIWIQHSGELYDINNIVNQSYLSDTNGTVTANISWIITNYIEVSESQKITINGINYSTPGVGVYGIFYDSAKSVVGYIAYTDYKINGTVLTIPSEVEYVRLSVPIHTKDDFSVKTDDKIYILNANNIYEELQLTNTIASNITVDPTDTTDKNIWIKTN